MSAQKTALCNESVTNMQISCLNHVHNLLLNHKLCDRLCIVVYRNMLIVTCYLKCYGFLGCFDRAVKHLSVKKENMCSTQSNQKILIRSVINPPSFTGITPDSLQLTWIMSPHESHSFETGGFKQSCPSMNSLFSVSFYCISNICIFSSCSGWVGPSLYSAQA